VPVRGLFLVGYMGTGKTTVGRSLAALLGWEFVDLDERIEAREGRSVPMIFREYGEGGFREREHLALRTLVGEISAERPAVVALGGGAFVEPRRASRNGRCEPIQRGFGRFMSGGGRITCARLCGWRRWGKRFNRSRKK
jgi:hypothetical protein